MIRSSLDPSASPRRRHCVAGGTLGLAAVAVGAVVAVGGTGAAAPTPAQASVRHGAHVVTIHVGDGESITKLNASLGRKYHELVFLFSKPGRATNHAPVLCRKVPGSHPRGPKLQVIAGNRNTETVAGNSGGGTYHLTSCEYQNVGFYKTGTTGAGA